MIQKKDPLSVLIRETLAEEYPELLTADGFDDAILGVVEGCGRETVVCYDYGKCVQILMRDSKMDEAEAEEFLNFNTVGAYVGKETPMFLHNWRESMA
ncbi:MAG TPA: hypothetical protein VNW90_25335 [Acetobacteraceae bacterium]|jgi:hypothetical protein|nr:hypothetical protein [Acetobacteraceae bacterium]